MRTFKTTAVSVFLLLPLLLFNNCGKLSPSTLTSSSNQDVLDTNIPETPVVTEALPGPELLSNPGFEDGLTGWSNGQILPGVGYLGTAGYKSPSAAGGISRNVNVVGGNTYRLVAYTRADQDAGGAVLRYSIALPGGGSLNGAAAITSTWQHTTLEFFVPVGVSSVFIGVWKNATAQSMYADDFSLRMITPLDPKPVLVSEGDSISVAGTHPTLYAGVASQLSFSALAVGGSGINTMTARKQAVISRKPSSGPWVVTFLIGANDLAGQDANAYAAKVFSYSDELRALGAKVAVGTVLPINLAHKVIHNQTRALYNQILRDNVGVHLDAVIDYDSDPLIGSDAAAMDPFMYPDGLHPSWVPGGGQDRMFQIYKPVVDRLLGKQP